MRVLSQPPEFGSMGTEPYFLATEAQLLGYYGELYVHSELQRTDTEQMSRALHALHIRYSRC